MERYAQSGAECDLDCLTVRATIYNTLDVPFFADREGFFGQIFSFMSSALTDDILSQGQASELLNFVHEVFSKAPLHHRQFAAKILRQAPQSEQAVKILYQLSDRAADKQDFDRAKLLHNAAMQRTRETISVEDWFSLAGYCYRDLDPAECCYRLFQADQEDGLSLPQRVQLRSPTGRPSCANHRPDNRQGSFH